MPGASIVAKSTTFVRCEEQERAKRAIGPGMRTVETGQALITSTSLDLGGVRQTLDPRANKHMGRLLDHWKTLRPQLAPLNRGGRLAD